MCKHILIQDFKDSDLELIKQFLALTHDRDGFGAVIRTLSGDIVTRKSLGIGEFYLDIGTLLQSGMVKDIVLHHRTSTNVTGIDYAHPFEFQGHYLTHNGVTNVPGKHATKTTNDSEALLHHLIKTGYETKSISGYFSCFILNKSETIILVDDIAPIFTDGRVYSSHKLGPSWTSVTLEKITIDAQGETRQPIEVTNSNYGRELSHLSLGADFGDDLPIPDNISYFLESLSEYDLRCFDGCSSKAELRQEIEIMSDILALPLLPTEIDELIEYFEETEATYEYRFHHADRCE